jgi:hypothetical protein
MKYCVFFVFFFSGVSLVAQIPKKDSTVLAQKIILAADSMMTAFKAKDIAIFSRFTHAGLKKIMGGEEVFLQTIQSSYQSIPDSAIKEMRVGKITRIIKEKNSFQCIVEQLLKIKVNTVTVTSTSYLVGESVNNGNTWSFFDASAETIFAPNNKVMPNLSKKLIIPAKKQQVDYQ